MSRAPGLLLLSAGLAVAVPAWTLPDTARVARDVARVFNAPEGYEVDRLRSGDTVRLLGVADRRGGADGAVWVRVRRPGQAGHRGWMRAGDLRPGGQASKRAGQGAPARADSAGQQWALAVPAMPSDAAEIPIRDMDFDCRPADGGRHLASCDLVTAFRVVRAPRLTDALIARVRCAAAISWTDISGNEHQQRAHAERRVPVDGAVLESSIRLSYEFPRVATSALVASQACHAEPS